MINPPRHGKREAERHAFLILELQKAVVGSFHDHVMQVLKEQGDYPPEVHAALGELQRAIEEPAGRCRCWVPSTCYGRGTEKCCEY